MDGGNKRGLRECLTRAGEFQTISFWLFLLKLFPFLSPSISVSFFATCD